MKFFIKIFIFILSGTSLVTSFLWQNCGKASNPVKVFSLDVYNNKTKVFYITGKGSVETDLTAPIQVKIFMQRKFFWGWTTIPCVDNLGSCDFDDLCALSHYINKPCAPKFNDNKIPCKCPIPQGKYEVKKFPVSLKRMVEEGTYQVKLQLFKDKEELVCSLMTFQL